MNSASRQKEPLVRYLDLSIPPGDTRTAMLRAFEQVLDHGQLIMGPEHDSLEREVAKACDRDIGLAVSSGSDAIFLALRAAGIGLGDEVITTSISWVATANAIANTGATPVFADVRDDLNIDPSSVAKLITKRTKAILPVHFAGYMSDMTSLSDLCKQHNILLIEDASQAFGASFDQRPAGGWGELACFSANPMKLLPALGEAGFIVTDDKSLAERIRILRYGGTINRETCVEPSSNYRMDTMQAAFLLVALDEFQSRIDRRIEIATRYTKALADIVRTPICDPRHRHVYCDYTIQTDERDRLQAFLEANGIQVRVRHPIAMPAQPAYQPQPRGEYQNALRLTKRILSLPVNDKLTDFQITLVIESIREFFSNETKP